MSKYLCVSKCLSLSLGISLIALPLTAMAEPDCTEAKDLINLVESFYAPDAELVNIIDPQLTMIMSALNNFPDPDGIRYIHEDNVYDLSLDEDGVVQNVEKALTFNKKGQLCKLVGGLVAEDTGEDSVSMNMNFTFAFRDTSGEHDIETLKEGLKDGSKVMKSLAPSGLGFVVPGLKALSVSPAEEDGALPQISFLSKGAPVAGPEITKLGFNQMFKMKALKKTKVDAIKITGAYEMRGQFNYDEEDIAESRAKMDADKQNTNE